MDGPGPSPLATRIPVRAGHQPDVWLPVPHWPFLHCRKLAPYTDVVGAAALDWIRLHCRVLWGLVRLAEAMSIGTRWSRVIGGIVYCLAPVIVALGGNPAAMMPSALLPWIMLPLVRSSVEGLPRRAAARSGVAIGLIGGVNVGHPGGVAGTPPLPAHSEIEAARAPDLVVGGSWAGKLSLDRPAHFAGTLRIELPAVRRNGEDDHLDGISLGGASRHLGVAELLPPRCASDSGRMDSRQCARRHRRDGPDRGHRSLGLALRRIPERFFLVLLLSLGMVLVAAGYGGHVSGVFGAGFVA